MRASRREINIFNMSLLDILCGALGAFCFMMLVLFPYYKPTGPNAADLTKENMLLEQELNELKKMLSERPDGSGMMEKLNQLQQRIQSLQGQLNKAQQQSSENDKTLRKLEARNPLTVAMTWDSQVDMDIFLEPTNFGYAGGKKSERMDPNKKQYQNFSDEVKVDVPRGPGTEVWCSRDAVAGGEQKVYYKLLASNGATQTTSIGGYFIYNGHFYRLPAGKLSVEKTSAFVGTLKNSADYRITFEPAPEFRQVYQDQLERDKKSSGENK